MCRLIDLHQSWSRYQRLKALGCRLQIYSYSELYPLRCSRKWIEMDMTWIVWFFPASFQLAGMIMLVISNPWCNSCSPSEKLPESSLWESERCKLDLHQPSHIGQGFFETTRNSLIFWLQFRHGISHLNGLEWGISWQSGWFLKALLGNCTLIRGRIGKTSDRACLTQTEWVPEHPLSGYIAQIRCWLDSSWLCYGAHTHI